VRLRRGSCHDDRTNRAPTVKAPDEDRLSQDVVEAVGERGESGSLTVAWLGSFGVHVPDRAIERSSNRSSRLRT